MWARRMGERWWLLRLLSRHALDQASLRLGGGVAHFLSPSQQRRVACRIAAALGPCLQTRRYQRTCSALQQVGLPAGTASRLGSIVLAHAWLRRMRLRHLRSLSFPAVKRRARLITWKDPQALWASGAGRRRVVCLLPTGDVELAIAAVLGRPGAPAHYFIRCPHAPGSVEHRILSALQSQGHRLDIGSSSRPGQGWRQLQRGATIIALLDPLLMARSALPGHRQPAPLRLARLARVPVLLAGHRNDDDGAGTLHVLGEFRLDGSAAKLDALYSAVQAFLAASPLDWMAPAG